MRFEYQTKIHRLQWRKRNSGEISKNKVITMGTFIAKAAAGLFIGAVIVVTVVIPLGMALAQFLANK